MNAAAASHAEQRLRRRFRWAAGWMLLHAGAHLPAHWRLFLHPDGPPEAQRVLLETLQAIRVRSSLGGTLWDVLGSFSLAYALILAALGALAWVLSREAAPDALRRHAWRLSLLGLLATLAIALLHPLVQPLLALGGAGLLFLYCACSPHPAVGERLRG